MFNSKNKRTLSKLFISSLVVFSLYVSIKPSQNIIDVNASSTYQNGDVTTYYNSIDSSQTGDDLLSSLRSLNLSKRKNPINYSNLNSYFKYTDYDPHGVKYDSNNQPYNTTLLSFYSGNSTTSYNKEHVWPNSRGGGSNGKSGSPYVENDIHMPRPTITAENSNRGNSSYVEGMAHSSNGWDPVTAFGVENCYQGENIRGECARIIFYCMTVNANLKIADDADVDFNSTRTTIGKLSDMLKWNLKYPVNEREERRNEGAEYLQGNRNAFIDHPEYACKIWGNSTSETKKVCNEYAPRELESLSINKTNAELIYGEKLQLSVTPEPSDSLSNVIWTSSNTNIVTVSSIGLVTALDKTGSATITATSIANNAISVSCVINVNEPSKIDVKSINVSNISLQEGSVNALKVSYLPENAYPNPAYTFSSSDKTVAIVDENGNVTGINAGSATITINAYQNSVLKATNACTVTITQKTAIPDSITINFKSAAGDGGAELTDTANIKKQISDGADYISSATGSKIFAGKSGLKLGASSSIGKLDLNFASSIYNNKISSILISSEKYNSDTGKLILSMNGNSVLSNISPGSDATYKPNDSIAIASLGLSTSSKRAYIKSITLYFEAVTTYTSDDFALDFYNSISCDVTGENHPTFKNGKTWNDFKNLYNSLSSTEKDKLIYASYNVSGSGSSTIISPIETTTQNIANAMFRYDYIISKYNTLSIIVYEEFILGRSSALLITPLKYNYAFEYEDFIIMIIILFTVFSSLIYINLVTKKRRNH